MTSDESENSDLHDSYDALQRLFDRRAGSPELAASSRASRIRGISDVIGAGTLGYVSPDAARRILNDSQLLGLLRDEWKANPPSDELRRRLQAQEHGFALLSVSPLPEGQLNDLAGGELTQDIEAFLFLSAISADAQSRGASGHDATLSPDGETGGLDATYTFEGPGVTVTLKHVGDPDETGLMLVCVAETYSKARRLRLQLRDGTTLLSEPAQVDPGDPVEYFIQATATPADVVHVELLSADTVVRGPEAWFRAPGTLRLQTEAAHAAASTADRFLGAYSDEGLDVNVEGWRTPRGIEARLVAGARTEEAMVALQLRGPTDRVVVVPLTTSRFSATISLVDATELDVDGLDEDGSAWVLGSRESAGLIEESVRLSDGRTQRIWQELAGRAGVGAHVRAAVAAGLR